MLKKCFASMVIVGLISSVAFAANEFPYDKELVGKLHLGLSAQAVEQIIPGQPTLGAEESAEADGKYHQEWKYPAAGITLGMVSEKKEGLKTISSITISSPSTLKTQRGIGIGSSAAEVAEAYGPFRNAKDSTPERFVAGSDFGGVSFDFQQGKVSGILFVAEKFDWTKETVGKLRPDLSEKEVKQIIPGQPKRGKDEWWGADDYYHQDWQYPKEGVTLSMVSKKKGGPKSIERITLTSPSPLQTSKGIRIGSTEAEVNEAYGRFRNPFDSEHFKCFIAGSIFGGVMFNFEQGKVSWIFIGANAE